MHQKYAKTKERFGKEKLGGRLRYFTNFWKKITKDRYVLNTIQGLKLEFYEDIIPCQDKLPHLIQMNEEEKDFMNRKIPQMIENCTIREVTSQRKKKGRQWLSNVFLRPKKDGGFRMILNLKPLNEKLKYEKFKMNTIQDVMKMLSRNMVMASIDLTEAYFHLPIFHDHIPFFRFMWEEKMYEYCALPNGLCSGPRIFTRITKEIMKFLRKKLTRILIYIDDTFLCAETVEELEENINITLNTFRNCGFTINTKKSKITPTTELEFLGFKLNSISYTITLLDSKHEKIHQLCTKVVRCKKITIKMLAKVIGYCIATFPASEHAQLHYRTLERFKVRMLRQKQGRWTAKIRIDSKCRKEIKWWI